MTYPLVVDDGDFLNLSVSTELILEIDFSSPDRETKDTEDFGLGRVLEEREKKQSKTRVSMRDQVHTDAA